jgi:ligand-binding sensor domain-containing protein
MTLCLKDIIHHTFFLNCAIKVNMKIRCLFFILFSSLCSYGQWFDNTTTFTTQNGLSNNTITSLKKDEAGFLWIGTHEGLNRYDGTEFINVLSNSKNNLPSNNITRICFINSHTLAIGTTAGLCLLNTNTLKGIRIALPFNPNSASNSDFVEDIYFKKSTKELWISTWHGIFIMDENGKLLKKIMASDSKKNICFAKNMLLDKQGDVYFYSAQMKGFFYPDFDKKTLYPIEQRMPDFPLNDFLKKDYVVRSAQQLGNEGTCTFSKNSNNGTEEYLSYYNITTGKKFIHKVVITHMQEKRLFNAFPLNDSVFLLNSYFGNPMLYNPNTRQARPASEDPLWFSSWPDGFAVYAIKDSNNIWVGMPKGLLQASRRAIFFKTNNGLVNTVKENQGLVSYNSGIFFEGKFWIACMGAGMFYLDTASGKTQTIFPKNNPDNINRKRVSTQIVPAGKNLWLYSVYGPVEVNATTLKLSLIPGINKDSLFDAQANFPLTDKNGNIWSTLPTGISRYDQVNNVFTNYRSKYIGGSFPMLRAGPKTTDGAGNIWMARQDTLLKYDPVKQIFALFFLKDKGHTVKPVTSLASDGGDILYMGIGGALGLYHISTGKLDLFTKQTGIISTVINDIVSDASGNAWIATEGGLIFYNKQKMKFSSFTKADGLPDDDIIGINFTDASKETLFLGFAKTYCLFRPQNFLLQKSVPVNFITDIEVNGESISGDGEQKFAYTQNSISFGYTGINFNQGRQNNYACMLEGFDQDWKYSGAERKINYINLPPGTYTFKVKSANYRGEWNEQPATFTFKITPPFWQQLWFRLLLLCVVVLGFYYFVKQREAKIKKEDKIKLQMSELRIQALRAQMNPHFIFNSLNSIQNYILSNNTIDAAGYLSKFAKLMRRILDQSKHNFLPLGEVMETLKMYVEMEAFRFNNEFSYSFDVEEDDELLDARVPPMLLQPFAENAILHGLMPKAGDKKLFIGCRLLQGAIEITIDDNGIGRTRLQAKAGHDSQGEKLTAGMLESMQQIQNIKATIEIIDKKENEISTGTTVRLVLPLK